MKYVIDIDGESIDEISAIELIGKDYDGHVVIQNILRSTIELFDATDAYHKGFDEACEATKGMAEEAANEAWEAAKKIFALDDLEAEKCGLDDVDGMTASEAIAKLKAYEERKKADSEIKVGDEVMCAGEVGIVYKVDDEYVHGTCNDDRDAFITFSWEKKLCRKTGRHFAKVAELKREVVNGPN